MAQRPGRPARTRFTLSALIFIGATTLLSPPPASGDDDFARVVRAHFRAADICWKMQRLPSRRVVEKEISAFEAAADRFWPEDQEAPYRLFVLALTEGGGRTQGKAKDPDRRSYGVMHIKYEEALLAARAAGLKHPDPKKSGGEDWFRRKLQDDIRFNVMCGAAFLRLCQDDPRGAKGDPLLAMLAYKYGQAGLRRRVKEQGVKKILRSKIAAWTLSTQAWINCIRDKVARGDRKYCSCG